MAQGTLRHHGEALPSPSLLPALISALDGPQPEACLEAALRVLSAHGIVRQTQPTASTQLPWLEIQQGLRSLILVVQAGTQTPNPATRLQVHDLLSSALRRASEYDELRRMRERWDLLSTASFEGIMIHVDGVIIELNRRFGELLGYEPEEMFSPEMILRAVAPEDLAEAQTRIKNRVEGEFLVTLVRKDGSRFRAEFHTKQSRFGDRPIRVVALRDVTQREHIAELLRESETRLRRILEATFDSVLIIKNGVVVDLSATHFFGRPRDEVVGNSVLECVAPSSRKDVAQRVQDGVVGAYEAMAMGANNEPVPVEVVSIMSTLNGEPVRVSGLRDLRAARRLEQERRRLELQVERSQRLESLGVLAGGIAHDFNNLLVGVLGSAELLALGLKDPEQLALAETIRVAAESAAGLTKQMLAYAGRREVHAPELVDISELCRELRGLLDAALSKKAHIELALSPGCTTMGERATLMQVLMNLLTNASDALEDKPGSIQVTTQRVSQPDARWDDALGASIGPGDWIMVQVRDSGVGMDLATQRRVFEPFFTTKQHGHGLGLGSCLGIVAAHGGAILVESAPQKGSTFSVLLPAVSSRSSPPPPLPKTAARSCNVLIVDDEPLVRTHLRRILELRGFTVRVANDGQAALAAIAAAAPDLLLLDVTMPVMDGVEVVRRLRAAGSGLAVLLCSGNLDYALEHGLPAGMVQGVLQKPFSTDELLAAIERARGA